MFPLFDSWVLTVMAYIGCGLLFELIIQLKIWRRISWLEEYLTWIETDRYITPTPLKELCKDPVDKFSAWFCFALWPLCLFGMIIFTIFVSLVLFTIFLGFCLNHVIDFFFYKLPQYFKKIRNISSCINFCSLS